MKHDIWTHVRSIFAILVGETICAFAITHFYIPHQLLSGGIGGIAIVVQYVFHVNVGLTVFILNIPLFIVGYKILNRYFILYAFFSATVFSVFLTTFQHIFGNFNVADPMLASIFGGALNGLGMGIMFRNNTCQGGLDIAAAIVKKKWNINIGTALMGMNLVIISIASILFGITSGMYTIIAMYISYKLVDKIIMGFDAKKQMLIISDEYRTISTHIMKELGRGVTILEGEGAYTGAHKKILYCVSSNRQIAKVKNIVDMHDPEAFFSVSDMVEVRGKGFASNLL